MPPDVLFWLALAVKMTVAATLVVAATMMAERSGALVGALIATLPVSAGPSFIFLALDHSADFIAASALRGVLTNCAIAVYLAVYVVLAQRHGLAVSLTAGFATWIALTALQQQFEWNVFTAIAAMAVLFTSCSLLTREYRHAPMPPARRQWYDIPLRATLVAALVGAVITLSFRLGPELTGILAAAPVVMTSIILLLHRRVGGKATAAVMANSIPANVGVGMFLLTLHLAAVPYGFPIALAAGLAMAVAWNLGLYAMRRQELAI